jgi:integrase/recombinase XerD
LSALELQSRYGARIGEFLRIRVKDIDGRKIIVQNPKSGKERKAIFLIEQVADRMRGYIQERALREQNRVFNLSYATAPKMINKLGEKVGIKPNPHDLRRHPATFANMNGMPLELISKLLLRHQDLKTPIFIWGELVIPM